MLEDMSSNIIKIQLRLNSQKSAGGKGLIEWKYSVYANGAMMSVFMAAYAETFAYISDLT